MRKSVAHIGAADTAGHSGRGVALPERRRMLVGDELDQAPDADAVVRTGTST